MPAQAPAHHMARLSGCWSLHLPEHAESLHELAEGCLELVRKLWGACCWELAVGAARELSFLSRELKGHSVPASSLSSWNQKGSCGNFRRSLQTVVKQIGFAKAGAATSGMRDARIFSPRAEVNRPAAARLGTIIKILTRSSAYGRCLCLL